MSLAVPLRNMLVKYLKMKLHNEYLPYVIRTTDRMLSSKHVYEIIHFFYIFSKKIRSFVEAIKKSKKKVNVANPCVFDYLKAISLENEVPLVIIKEVADQAIKLDCEIIALLIYKFYNEHEEEANTIIDHLCNCYTKMKPFKVKIHGNYMERQTKSRSNPIGELIEKAKALYDLAVNESFPPSLYFKIINN